MSTKPTSIRIDEATDAKLDEASKLSGLPKADIMRFALAVGLKDLELIGYDVTAAIHTQVLTTKQARQEGVDPQPAIGFHQSSGPQSKQAHRVRANLKSKSTNPPRA